MHFFCASGGGEGGGGCATPPPPPHTPVFFEPCELASQHMILSKPHHANIVFPAFLAKHTLWCPKDRFVLVRSTLVLQVTFVLP